MTMIYSDQRREEDQHALPDLEVFYHDHQAAREWQGELRNDHGALMPEGWYWWACLPGCLPDGDPTGPFDTEQEAINDARSS